MPKIKFSNLTFNVGKIENPVDGKCGLCKKDIVWISIAGTRDRFTKGDDEEYFQHSLVCPVILGIKEKEMLKKKYEERKKQSMIVKSQKII